MEKHVTQLVLLLHIVNLTITNATAQNPLQVLNIFKVHDKDIGNIKVGESKYKEWPSLRSLLEGIGQGYLMILQCEVPEDEKIGFRGEKIDNDPKKPVSVAFLAKNENGLIGLVSFLVRLLDGHQQIIFYVSREDTVDEAKADWAKYIGATVFEGELVKGRQGKLGCTKKEFIHEVTEMIVNPRNADGDAIVHRITKKFPKICRSRVLKGVKDRMERGRLSEIVGRQFTSLLNTVEQKLGVQVIRQPDPNDAIAMQKYIDGLIKLSTFKIKRIIGDNLAGKGAIGESIKPKMYEPLAWMGWMAKGRNQDETDSAIWAAGSQSFRSNTITPSAEILETMEDWEKERLIKGKDVSCSPSQHNSVWPFL